MNGIKTIGFIGLCSIFLVACSANNGADAYLSSKNGPDLVVPPPLTSANMGYFYKLPPQPQQNARVGIKPPTV